MLDSNQNIFSAPLLCQQEVWKPRGQSRNQAMGCSGSGLSCLSQICPLAEPLVSFIKRDFKTFLAGIFMSVKYVMLNIKPIAHRISAQYIADGIFYSVTFVINSCESPFIST